MENVHSTFSIASGGPVGAGKSLRAEGQLSNLQGKVSGCLTGTEMLSRTEKIFIFSLGQNVLIHKRVNSRVTKAKCKLFRTVCILQMDCAIRVLKPE